MESGKAEAMQRDGQGSERARAIPAVGSRQRQRAGYGGARRIEDPASWPFAPRSMPATRQTGSGRLPSRTSSGSAASMPGARAGRSPAPTAQAMQAYAEETNRLNRERRASGATDRKELADIEKLLANFASQNSLRDLGKWVFLQPCRCQKQPWTKITARRRPKTRSGRPGSSRTWVR